TYAGVSLAGANLVTTRLQDRSSVWSADAAGGGSRLSGQEVEGNVSRPTWTDGQHVVYQGVMAGGAALWGRDMTTGARHLMVPGARTPSTTADGRTLVFLRGGSANEQSAIWRADASGAHVVEVFRGSAGTARVLPDGSAVVFVSSQSGLQSP